MLRAIFLTASCWVFAVLGCGGERDELRVRTWAVPGVQVALPQWTERTPANSRAISDGTTTGSPAVDQHARDARRIVAESGRVEELVLIRDPRAELTSSIHVSVHASDSSIPMLELARRAARETASPGFVVLQEPAPLTIDGVSEAVHAKFRRRLARTSDPATTREGDTWILQLRHRGHLVTITLTAPVAQRDELAPLFERIVASIRVAR